MDAESLGGVAGIGTLRTRVEMGRLVLDEPTMLPKGTVLDLCVAEAEDELGHKERAALKGPLGDS